METTIESPLAQSTRSPSGDQAGGLQGESSGGHVGPVGPTSRRTAVPSRRATKAASRLLNASRPPSGDQLGEAPRPMRTDLPSRIAITFTTGPESSQSKPAT